MRLEDMGLQAKLRGPGVILCTFDADQAQEYSKCRGDRTEVKLFGKTYLVVSCEFEDPSQVHHTPKHELVIETRPRLYWFEFEEVIPCQ